MTSQVPLVYVVILNWNQREDTLACIDSVSKLTYPNFRILLVDNGSVDGTTDVVTKLYPEIDVIENKENLGFGKGNNVGMNYALDQGAQYVFLLNNDTLIEPQALTYLVDSFQMDQVGIVSPKIYYANGNKVIWSIGGNRHPLTMEMTGDIRGQIDQEEKTENIEKDYLVGCAMLFSRDFIKNIGFFDDRFFMYYEDSDISLRAKTAGYKLLLVPKAIVWHKVAQSSGGSDSPNERYWMAKSSVIFFHKHARGLRLFIVIPYRIGSAVKTLFRLVIKGNIQSAKSYVRGLVDGLRDI